MQYQKIKFFHATRSGLMVFIQLQGADPTRQFTSSQRPAETMASPTPPKASLSAHLLTPNDCVP